MLLLNVKYKAVIQSSHCLLTVVVAFVAAIFVCHIENIATFLAISILIKRKSPLTQQLENEHEIVRASEKRGDIFRTPGP